ncbi:sensor domain-containing protein [Saccharopolyspora sp. NPDC050389]|uniref:sensor histidine kinase n=1 Tax=Saccharopolyspora sp. NPDC050389 TaxID=3155516 RepID=UPI0033F8EC18
MTLRKVVRDAGFLLPGLATGLAALVAIPLILASGLLVVIGVGVILLPGALTVLHRFAEWQRRRAGRQLGVPTPRIPSATGFVAVLRASATWRDLRWLPVHVLTGVIGALIGLVAVVGPPATVVTMLIWPVLPNASLLGIRATSWPLAVSTGAVQLALVFSLLWWGVPALARWQAKLALSLLSPSAAQLKAAELAERVDELAETRAGALEAHGAELRRIERDLHDGTQAQLVALAIRLGIAEKAAHHDPEMVIRMLQEARDGAEEAMTGLRNVVRTLYPPILADRGLAGAASALGARCAVPTSVTVEELGEVPAAVEAAAYFVVAEALNNVTKHAAATHAFAVLDRVGDELRIEVGDDGVGGIDESKGTGVAGIRHRVAALDGWVSVVSPVGGPTGIQVVLPCGS